MEYRKWPIQSSTKLCLLLIKHFKLIDVINDKMCLKIQLCSHQGKFAYQYSDEEDFLL